METHPLPPAPPGFPQPGLSKASPLKSLPAPLRLFIRPLLLVALGIHALLLFTPLPAEQKPKPPEDKKSPVKITQVPTVKPVKTTQPAPAAKTNSNPQQPRINRSSEPPTSTSAPSEKPKEKPADEKKDEESRPAGNVPDPFVDFPHYQPSTPDCFNKGLGDSCRTTNSPIATVAAFYKSELPKKEYTIDLDEEGTGKQIFRVSKGGKTRYIHFFEDTSGGTAVTVILLQDTKLPDLATFKGAVELPVKYVDLLTKLADKQNRGTSPKTIAEYEDFEKRDFFYKPITAQERLSGKEPETLPGFDSANLAQGLTPAQTYTSFFEADLKTIFTKEVKQEGEYGGGPLYKLTSDKGTIFLNLVPFTGAQGSKGTIVVTWLKDPRK